MEGTEQPSEGETPPPAPPQDAPAPAPAPAPAAAPAPAPTAGPATEADLLLDLKLLRSGFSPTPDKHLNLDGYLDAYMEMNKFLGVLGAIFNMVTNEVKSKVSILREHRQSPEGEHYVTVASLLRYEQGQAEGGVPGDRGAGRLVPVPCCASTVPWFVLEFMVLLMRPKEGFFGGQVSRLYGATLGRHHGALIRAGTSTALFTLPSHATIMQRLMKGKTVMADSVREEMDHITAAMRAAYDLTQELYQQYGYLDLP